MACYMRLRQITTCSAEPPAPPKQPRASRSGGVIEVTHGGRHRKTLSLGHASSEAAEHVAEGGARPPPPPPEVASSDGLLEAVKSFFLPRGFPDSVTDDYLDYQLITVPAHITGWVSHSLATSSMISALAVGGGGPAATVGITAAIKWITKDGLGAVGRLAVGGRLSSYFDEDPKRWRMIAELISTLGFGLEISTQLFPSSFVVLAGTGTLAKATSKGIGRPCFRVVQTHFAASNNVGDVSAKEEVWEVSAQLVGIAASVAVLGALEASDMQQAVVPVWAAVHALHVALRYQALATLRLPWPNQKRAALLVSAHVAEGVVPSVAQANQDEPILLTPGQADPAVELGCTVEQLLAWAPVQADKDEARSSSSSSGSTSTSSSSSSSNSSTESGGMSELLELYSSERYLLTWQDGTARVLLWQDARPMDMLRAMYQAAWLNRRLLYNRRRHAAHHFHEQQMRQRPGAVMQELLAPKQRKPDSSSNTSSSSRSSASNAGSSNGSSKLGHVSTELLAAAPAGMEQLEESLIAMQERFTDFREQARQQGWKLGQAVLLSGPTRLREQLPQQQQQQ